MATETMGTKTTAIDHNKVVIVVIATSMFITGACGMVYEYLLSTVSTYILGSSVEQFSITIGLMMFMMAVAGWVQRSISDKALVEKFIIAETLLALIGGSAPLAIYAAFGLMEQHFNLILYSYILSIGFLIGLEIPLAMRINEKYGSKLSNNIANTWSFDYIGSLVGSLFFALVLIRLLPLTEISIVLAFFNVAIATVTLVYFASMKKLTYSVAPTILICVVTLALALGLAFNRQLNFKLEQKLYDDKIVFATTTKYQRLVMTHKRGPDEYRFYINGNLQFSSADEAIYHEELIHPIMSMQPNHRRVLILGGGDGLALREILKYPDVEQVTLVDLDPEMTRICSADSIMRKLNNNSFGSAKVQTLSRGAVDSGQSKAILQQTGNYTFDSGRKKPKLQTIAQVSVYNVDADMFIGKDQRKWDVVVIDLPDPTSIELSKLYSREFYMKVKRVMAENGLMVVQSTSPYHAKEAFLCTLRTIESAGLQVMPYHDNVPSFGDWGFVMGKKLGGRDLPQMADYLDRISVETRYLTPEVFRSARVFGKGSLETKERKISQLMQPAILDYYVREGWKIE